VGDALAACATVHRTALRRAVAPHSVESWCDAHRSAFERLVEGV
jgi:hypothetical protein